MTTFAEQMAADAAHMLSDFGITVKIDNGSFAGAEITGIFDNLYVPVEQHGGIVEMSQPTLLVLTSDIEDFTEHETRLIVNNTDYLVTGIENNHDGFTSLSLREA